MRIELRQKQSTVSFYVIGDCYWIKAMYRDGDFEPTAETAPDGSGVNCIATAAINGSAEDRGDLEIEIAKDGNTISLHVSGIGLGGWRGGDQSKPSQFLKLGDDDLTFRLTRVAPDDCAGLERAVRLD